MTTSMPMIFDTLARTEQRKRAARLEMDASFIHSQVAEIISERLEEVNREFTNPLIIGWDAVNWSERLGLSVETTQDTENLGIQSTNHDLCLHLLGLHSINDPVGQLIQMRRAMQPDGLMIAACFGGQTLQELRAVLGQAEADITGGISPRIAPMGDMRDLGALLQRAGYTLPVADNFCLTVAYSSISRLFDDLRAMGERNVQTGRRALRRDVLKRAEELYWKHFSENGKLIASFDVLFLTGWSPAPDQPKPLRPGSASTRLADALGTIETKLDKT